MSVLELVNTLSLGVIAVSAAVMAFLLANVIAHFQSISRSLVLLLLFLRKAHEHDPDPHHHEVAFPLKSLVVWEWRNESWELRPECGPLESAGPPPDRAGKFDGECVTRRKANA